MLYAVAAPDQRDRDPPKPPASVEIVCGDKTTIVKTSTGKQSASPLERALGLRLRQLRLARSLSLAEVAQATNISASFLSLVENGRSDVSIGRLTRLVQFYGVSLSDVIPGTER